MDLSKMTNEEARAIVAQAQNVFDASIADQQRSSPKEIQSLPLNLTVARNRSNAMKVSFPFKSVLVEQATDLQTYVYMIPISNDSGNDAIRLGLKDVYKNEFGFRECYIYWDAQPAKSILLKFFVRSIIENGRLVLDQNSVLNNMVLGYGVSQNDGFTFDIEVGSFVVPAAANIVTEAAIGRNVQANNLGFYSITTGGLWAGNTFKVPKGYVAELLSAEMEVITTTTASFGIDFCELEDLVVYNTSFDLINSPVGVAQIFVTKGYAALTKLFMHVDSGTNNVTNKNARLLRNRFFNEEKIIAPIIYSLGAAGGIVNMRVLLRLTKKVG